MTSFNRSAPVGLQQAQVLAVQPPNKLLVFLPAWGSGTRVPVTILGHGQNDALRVRQFPLPKPGTWGGILFMHGDSRNGMWMGSYTPALANAHTNKPGDGDVTYEAENSGYWHYRDGTGADTTVFPDGSSVTISPSGTPLVPTRTVVEGQFPVVQEVEQSQRASIKEPVQIVIRLAGGLTWTLSGNTGTLTGNLVVDGAITATGNVTAGEGTGDQADLLGHEHRLVDVQPGSYTLTTTAPIAGT